ncbi:MAG: hypothetical protein ACE5Z5_03985 [Candidatus Bathyarchaeia archaeon]
MFCRGRLRQRKRFLLLSILVLYPLWAWLFIPVGGMLFYRDVRPEMPWQERYITKADIFWVEMFFVLGHPDIIEGYGEGIGYYRTAGRPDLAMRTLMVGGILIGWGFASKIYAVTAFPFFLYSPYLSLNPRTKQILKAALIILCLSTFVLFSSHAILFYI